jgi:hypothetical protein
MHCTLTCNRRLCSNVFRARQQQPMAPPAAAAAAGSHNSSSSSAGQRPVLLLDVMDTLVTDPFFEHMPRFFNMSFKELLAAKHPTGMCRIRLHRCCCCCTATRLHLPLHRHRSPRLDKLLLCCRLSLLLLCTCSLGGV